MRLSVGLRLGLILIIIGLAWLIVVQTRIFVHPDEFVHLDAFHYFEQHWWPPNLNIDGLTYSVYGWSRVYTGELVYILYGQLAHHSGVIEISYLTYRLFNLSLLVGTLMALFFITVRWFPPMLIGLVFVCVPQIIYLYAYANSDAWGLSVSILLFLWVAKMVDQPPDQWTWRQFVGLGVGVGLIFIAKLPFWFALILPALLLLVHCYQASLSKPALLKLLKQSTITIVIVIIIAAPLQVIYPLTQPNYTQQIVDMREQRAQEGYKPSQYQTMIKQDHTFFSLFFQTDWLKRTLKSSYGDFGYSEIEVSTWGYLLASIAVLLSVGLSLSSLIHYQIPGLIRVAMLSTSGILLISILASLYNSLYIDFQPQGRYLFGTFLPIAFILVGPIPYERGWRRYLRAVLFGVMYLACIYNLFFYSATHFILSRPQAELFISNPFQTIEPVYKPFGSGLTLAGFEKVETNDALMVKLIWRAPSNVHVIDFYHHLITVAKLDQHDQPIASAEVKFIDIIPVGNDRFESHHYLPVSINVSTRLRVELSTRQDNEIVSLRTTTLN